MHGIAQPMQYKSLHLHIINIHAHPIDPMSPDSPLNSLPPLLYITLICPHYNGLRVTILTNLLPSILKTILQNSLRDLYLVDNIGIIYAAHIICVRLPKWEPPMIFMIDDYSGETSDNVWHSISVPNFLTSQVLNFESQLLYTCNLISVTMIPLKLASWLPCWCNIFPFCGT